MNGAADDLIVRGDNLTKRFERQKLDTITALNRVSFGARQGALTALVGPDGAGKTTLLRLAAGLMRAMKARSPSLGLDAAEAAASDSRSHQLHASALRSLRGPERAGKSAICMRISMASAPEQRAERYPRLMEMTALAPFLDRLAGKLSGGMKQKLGLACTLVRSPELLLLDEPTVGVDPLSRRELWDIVERARGERRLVRDRQHVLHGRGGTLRARRGATRRQCAGERHAERVDVAREWSFVPGDVAARDAARKLQAELIDRPRRDRRRTSRRPGASGLGVIASRCRCRM